MLWPREAHLTEDDVFWGMTLAAAELLRFGVTTTCEAYFLEDALADAVIAAGSRALVTPGVLQLPGAPSDDRWWDRRIGEIVDFHARRHGDHGRIEVGFAPHAAYTVPLPVLADIAGAARQLDALFHIHLAETELEGARFEAEHGRSVPVALAEAGVLGGRSLAAHSIWLSPGDMDIYGEYDVAVAHCPQSNAKLASGVAPLVEFLDRGIRVGLGTDGPASNNDLDLWEDMRFAAMLARIREEDAAALPAATALDLATRGAGRALGRPDLGVLAAGGPADMVAMELDDPVFVPWLEDDQLVDHLVWAASSRLVTDVWVAGRQVVEHGRCTTVDVDRARERGRGQGPPVAGGGRLTRRPQVLGAAPLIGRRRGADRRSRPDRRRTRRSCGRARRRHQVAGGRDLLVERRRPGDHGARPVGREGDVGPVVAHRKALQDGVAEMVGRVPGHHLLA